MTKRELQFDDGKSQKFWTIVLKGTSHTVTFGRTGTKGQTRTKEFDTQQEAKNSYDKLVKQKLGKGYADAKKQVATSKRKGTRKKAAVNKKVIKKVTKKKAVKRKATEKFYVRRIEGRCQNRLIRSLYCGACVLAWRTFGGRRG